MADMYDLAAQAESRALGGKTEPAVDPYQAAADAEAQQNQLRARTVFERSLAVNPDQAAQSKKLMNTTGLPLSVIERNLDEVKRKEQARALDMVRMAQDSPVLARQMMDPTFTNQAHDDVSTLAAIETGVAKAVRYMMGATPSGGVVGDLQAGVLNSAASLAGGKRAVLDTLEPFLRAATGDSNNRLAQMSQDYASQAKAWRDAAAKLSPQTGDMVGDGVSSGVQSFVQNAKYLPAALLGPVGGAAALYGMVAESFGSSYNKAADKGLPLWQSLGYAGADAAVEYWTEKMPLDALIGGIAKNAGFIKTVAKSMALEIPGEQVATILQDLNEWATINPGKPFKDYLAERPSAAVQTLIATVIGTGGNVAVVHGVAKVTDQIAGAAWRNDMVTQQAELLQEQLRLATQSTLRERNPEEFRAVVQAMAENTEGAPQAVYVDAEVLAQLPQDVLNQLPGVADQMEQALASGDVVAIKMADVLTVAPGTALEKMLVEHGRVGDPMAQNQVEALAAGEQAQVYLQQQTERVIQQAADQQAMQESHDRVRQGVLDQLAATKRFRKDVNEGYATWVASFYTTMAGRLGVTPEQFRDGGWTDKQGNVQPPRQINIVGQTGAGKVLNEDEGSLRQAYGNAPNSLMGFKKDGPQKPFGTQNYKHVQYVRLTDEKGTSFVDAMSGLNGPHALERARRNWTSFEVSPITEAEAVAEDPTIAQDVAQAMVEGAKYRETLRQNKAAVDQTQTPEFKAWFGDSKVVDAAGAPLVVYHGTGRSFAAFDPQAEPQTYEADRGKQFFTNDAQSASGYAEAAGDGANVMPLYLSLQNPRIETTDGDPSVWWDENGAAAWSYDVEPKGHDGLIVVGGGGKSLYVTSKPTQIKSAIGNSGAFDPGDANILKQADAKVNNLTSVAERGERVTGTRAMISAEEKAAIVAASEKVGVSVKEITAVVRGHKLAHPPAQGWAPLVFNRAVIDKGKVSYEYKSTPYSFNADKDGTALEPGTPEYKRRVNAVAKAMTEEVRRVFQRAAAGDKNAQNILAQAGWYKAMRSRLRQEFGGLGDLFADLLGATSPNTPVRDNWTNAVDSLRRASRGDFDALIPQWEAHYDRLEALELDLRGWFNERLAEGLKKNKIKALPEYETKIAAVRAARELPEELLPTKESGKKYGFNGKNVARAMVDLWRVVRNADPDIARGGTAPKALNFSGNLIGFRERATIDVWAARMLQRLAGGVRVPSMAETGVSGDMREDATTTLGFGFGQDVFSAAVKRIRADEELKTDKTLADVNDDDLQAVVWFVEKELWTVNNWTSVSGEGGSFELEASLTGSAEQAKIRELRKTLDSSKSKPAAKAAAREELAKLERTVDRFVGGLSIQMSADTQGIDFVPTDADMARLAEQIRLAVYEADEGNTVLASKALSTEGRYGGVERSLDLEVVAREGYDANQLWREMLQQAQAAKQDSTFLSRVLREHEEYDPVRHRPGVEIYFREAASKDKLESTLANLAKEGVEFLTVIVDGRRLEGATEGAMPPAVGVRLQYVPEFDQRYGFDDLAGLDDDGIRAKMESKAAELRALAERVTAAVEGVSFAGQFWYDTQVAFAHEYQEKIDGIAAGIPEAGVDRVGGPQWSGQPVRQGLESANRQAGKTTSGEPLQPDGAVGGDAAGTGGDQLLFQPALGPGSGAANGNDGRDGRSAQPHAVDLTGVHFSTGERSRLDGRYFGTGLKGLERVRLRDATDQRIKERLYFYVDEGAGVRPEAGVGGFAHEAQLRNLYNTQGDPLKLFKANDLNGSESRVLDAGYDGYYFPAYANQQGIAVLMGNATRGLAVTATANPTRAAPDTAPPQPYKRGLMSRELNMLDMAPVQAAAPSAKLLAGTFQVDQAEFDAAQAAMRAQGIELPSVFNQPARGTFNPKTLELALNENADLSTFFHETGHFFLEVMADLASQGAAPVEVREDMDVILKWFGVPDLATWQGYTLEEKRPYHERFAESIEQYILEGKAPSAELQPAFRRFKSWMLSVYQNIKSFIASRGGKTDIQLSDDVRKVFDRMLASEEQIKNAEEVAGLLPDMDATPDAVERLTARSIRDLKWAVNARSKMIKAMQAQAAKLRKEVEAEVTAEVDEMPEFLAKDALDKLRETTPEYKDALKDWGDRRDAAKERAAEEVKAELLAANPEVKGLQKGQLLAKNKKDLANQAAARVIAWEKQNPKPVKPVPANADAQMESIASKYGFDSVDAMLQAIDIAGSKDATIEGMTDQRMLERHGDLIDQRAIEQAATEAVHNEARAKSLATELAAQADMLNPREDTGKTVKKGPNKGSKITVNAIVQAAKIFASNIVARTTVRDLQSRARQHMAAEARAGKRWEEATSKGDTKAAVKAKQDQVLNNAAAKAALEAKGDVDKMIDYLKKFEKEGTRKNLAVDYLDQIDKLLEAIDLRKSTTGGQIDKRASLRKWVESQHALGLDPILPDELLDGMAMTSYKEMTVDAITGLVDVVKNIEHLGRLKSKLLAAKDKREFDVIANEIADSIKEHGGTELPVKLEPDGRIKQFFKGAWVDHRKLNSLIHQMDGGKDNGPFYRALVRSMNDAGTAEAVALEKATGALAKIYAPVEALPGGVSGGKLYIPEIKASLSRAGRLSVALNWGNAQNRQRLMDGDNWTEAQVKAILRTLNEVELKFVNDIWAHIDSYWPEVKAKQLRVSGVVEDKVEAEPFELEVGAGTAQHTVQMRGGYYPIKYDPDRSVRAERNEAKENALQILRGAIGRATTRRGHTKARVEEVKGRPVKKDLGVITQHINQVVHDLAWHEWFVDANRLMNDPRILGAIRDHYGPEVHRAMQDAAEAIAVGDSVHQGEIDKLLLLMRSNVTRSIMGASLTTALLQPFGLTQSMARIGVVPVLKGAARWAGDAARMESSMKWIGEKSDFMRLRSKTFNRELREISQRVRGKSKVMQVVDASLFALMQKMQMVADVPTWIGAYEKALAGGVDESAAVALADEAVLASQGGGTTKDLAAVQRNMPFLTQFYSYFNTTMNLVVEKTATTNFKQPAAVAGWLGDMVLLTVIPAILPALLTHLLKGGGEDDDPEAWAKRLASWQASYMLGMFVGLRELPALWSPFDYAGPPAGKLVNDGKRLVQQAGQGEIDDTAVLATIGFLGTALGIPTTQMIRSYKGWKAWDDGDAPATSILFGPPPKD